ncbi:leucine-rich repeat extensin-like protein 4 [Iris pallida]|uniref:Leucine-rich repeat extensin-like protein 4 n=1 Tax=Iris pallida TaxID=29817 RepID=A0AAX6FBD4_IRIPA|nr:leucine-rich repeat extensin-like protein 4 [Iris pallida]
MMIMGWLGSTRGRRRSVMAGRWTWWPILVATDGGPTLVEVVLVGRGLWEELLVAVASVEWCRGGRIRECCQQRLGFRVRVRVFGLSQGCCRGCILHDTGGVVSGMCPTREIDLMYI